jgi:hypothetical protein
MLCRKEGKLGMLRKDISVKYMALKDGHDFGKQRGRDSTVI